MAEAKFLNYEGLTTYDGKIKAYITTETTKAKTDAVTESKITIDTGTTSEGAAKSYAVKQNGATIATIDIPKDMVVSSGKVVTDPAGQEKGTYIELTLSDADSTKIYINVGTLVDLYTAKADAEQVQVAIDPVSREISATIVADSIDTTALKDGAVTSAKLDAGVKTSLGKADTAVQEVTTSETNGSISVDGEDVAVHGLASAAYQEAEAFDAAGTADTKVKALENGQVATNKSAIEALQTQVGTLITETPTAISTEDINALFED